MDTKPDICEKLNEAKFQLVKGPKSKEEDSEDDANSDSDSECDYRTSEIRKYKVQIVPPENIKFDVAPKVSFEMLRHKEEGEEKKAKWVRSFVLSCDLKDGQSRVDGFVNDALQYYKEVEGKKKDESRYLYTPLFSKSGNGDGDDSSTSMLFKRYQLSEEKTFQSFFHPEKQQLLRLLDHFTNKTGKFSIPGYPHKLGLLLHGPPGTGKTSLIKAVANYTKRNIISIPLARVKTNQELMDLVFDQACRVEGDDWTYKLPFKKTIFVMEDVDAAADVVNKRDDDDMKIPLSMLMGTKPKEKEKPEGPKAKKDAGTGGSSDGEEATVKLPTLGMGGMGKWMSVSDELNLAGILNVLDGVIDCPNRIVVMTTNHPEKLDPALIRPGRINKKMFLGLLKITEAFSMIEHYYGKLSEENGEVFRKIFPEEKLSPAALESLCADCDSFEELLEGVQKILAQQEGPSKC